MIGEIGPWRPNDQDLVGQSLKIIAEVDRAFERQDPLRRRFCPESGAGVDQRAEGVASLVDAGEVKKELPEIGHAKTLDLLGGHDLDGRWRRP